MSRVWQGTIWMGFNVVAWGEDKDHAIENMYTRFEREYPEWVKHTDHDEITDVEVIDSPSMRRMGLVRHG